MFIYKQWVDKTLGKSCFKVYNIRDTEVWSSYSQDAYVLTKSLISAPMGTTGSSSAKEVEAAGEFTIQTGGSKGRTKRQISRGESRDQRSPTPTAEVSQQLTGLE